eukprot:scaffold177019_cov16-Tisochrysis_lutea.AAC.1
MTNAISVRPGPPCRDFERKGWARLVRYKDSFLTIYVWLGWVPEFNEIVLFCLSGGVHTFWIQALYSMQGEWLLTAQLPVGLEPVQSRRTRTGPRKPTGPRGHPPWSTPGPPVRGVVVQ